MKLLKKRNACGGKPCCTAARIADRKLEYKIGSVLKSHTGTEKLISNGWRAALRKVTAHDGNDKICSGSASDFFQKIGMSAVKGIKFGNDTGSGKRSLIGCSIGFRHEYSFFCLKKV